MPTEQTAALKLKTNLDTGLLKLIAILSMAVDHVGSVFFPKYPVFRWIGRLTFPIFAYPLTVGLLYTHDIKKYLVRLLAMWACTPKSGGCLSPCSYWPAW